MLRKDFHYYYTNGFWNFSERFCVWFGQRTQTFHEMFWQVRRSIYFNISWKFLVKILGILHKILQKLFCNVSRNIQTPVKKFLNQYFHNLVEIFTVKLQEMLRKHSHYHCTEGFWYFYEIFCVWFGQRSQTFHEMFWQVWSKIHWNIWQTLLVKILETSDAKSCRNFSAMFFEIDSHYHSRKSFWNFPAIFYVILNRSHEYFTKYCGKFSEIFHASFLFRN